jgi:tetratricopeptide (TPR) repeat protein
MSKATDIGKLSDRAQRLMKAGRWDDAIKLFKANGPVVRKDWQLLWNLGWCYFRTDRIQDAEKYLTKAARLAPEAPACNFALGEIYLRKRQ